MDQLSVEFTTSCPDHLARLLSSSPADLAVVNSFAHVAQALCAVLGRQEEGLIMDQLISTCKAEDSYSSLYMALRLTVELWPDVRSRPAMLRLLVRTAAAGTHAYSALALLLDRAPYHEQLAPLALDLVWGMEGMLQPASWLPCGNSLVEGWCSQLLDKPEQVWGWQALAAGTPAEASLASVLQGAANKLQLPHLH
ncbi:hypothetical protein HaLaN_05344 [Haematococcus lacustris]|uniref:Uncharacterized protein n=1 Tax=Haematococcus lacustris TaxID=44745 RepID=A0A699YJ16_HAELA|nr:hypothetical protein HaLaN_05344 [Haematococcus lacustris]